MNELQTYINTYFNIGIDDLQEVEKLFQVTHLSKNEFVCKEDTKCDSLSFIISGHVRVFKYENGKEITQWISSPGELLQIFLVLFSTLMQDGTFKLYLIVSFIQLLEPTTIN